MTKTIAVTMGDSAGIGPEIIAKAFKDHRKALENWCFVVGDVATLRRAAQVVVPLGRGLAGGADRPPARGFAGAAPVHSGAALARACPRRSRGGRVSAAAGAAAAQRVQWAADAALRGEIAALVTAPLHKEALRAAGVDFPGPPNCCKPRAAHHAGVPIAQMPVRMMLANPELRTVLVSIHVSLRQALEAVTHENIVQTLLITHRALTPILGHAPRIAVAGLNPHAGEGGLFGREEVDTIAPAIAQARAAGVDALGPWPRILCSCAPAIHPITLGNLTWCWRCTTTRV